MAAPAAPVLKLEGSKVMVSFDVPAGASGEPPPLAHPRVTSRSRKTLVLRLSQREQSHRLSAQAVQIIAEETDARKFTRGRGWAGSSGPPPRRALGRDDRGNTRARP